ncbi:SWI/SNF-related matrix-associated actin-dependent regulator of chromatin subfamily A containing DEAD/H box 1A isoform X2 [Brienomyrus brachyistius]|uniref:SWI/SNF-related matrix-associated actin-dependent regulator of chromatin subfamily A containing DEAD/H box 1A isoform X2 n=1 Tax=Brienomyrus brachyistius TaxID=42636 RepID=UPI0020B3A121|nr:SWI/SNF-related matrix-associated actin-dependent regulator of chromatin subfamily A containing DEAD/H box 1A isoform X2 [Brienomyrus brachyistius]
MSFNLERFRCRGNERKRKHLALTQDRRGSAKSKQDKENTPSSTAQGTMQGQQTAEPDCQAPVLKTSVQTVEDWEEGEASREWCTGDEEMEEVIRTPSPLDLTLASCLTRQTDKGSAQKRKHGSVDSGNSEESGNEMERPNKKKKKDTSMAGVYSGDSEENDNEMERLGKKNTSMAGVYSGDSEDNDNEMERLGKKNTSMAGVYTGDSEDNDNEMERLGKKKNASMAGVYSGDSEENDNEMERPGKKNTSMAGVYSGDSEENDNEMERPGKKKKKDTSMAGVYSGDSEENDNEMERPGKKKKKNASMAGVYSGDSEENDNEMERPGKKNTSMAGVYSGDSEDNDNEMERPGKKKKQDTATAGATIPHSSAFQVAPSGRDKKKPSLVNGRIMVRKLQMAAPEPDGDVRKPNPGKKGPSLVDQGILVRKLQKAFPELDREELRDILQQHNWNMEQALDELYLSSDLDESPSCPEVRVRRPVVQQPVTGAQGAGERADPPAVAKKAGMKVTAAKAKVARRKGRGQTAADSYASTSEEEGSRDFEGSLDDDSDGGGNMDSELKAGIVEFFQQASVDELSLIRSCSRTKAQKIMQLRPFCSWRDLERAFHRGNQLSYKLLSGCKVVLKERRMVLEVMKNCEAIAGKMMKDLALLIQRGAASYSQPTVLNSKMQLKPFQLVGLHWLTLLHQNKLSGILADEMGLGKTVQTISFLASLYQAGLKGPHLITVPASTLGNWVRELSLWCPKLKVLTYQGNMEERRYLRRNILRRQVDFNVIISTYNMTIGCSGDRGLFKKLKLQYAVFDEGHLLKNMDTVRYFHLMEINAQYRLLLTGTPLQNNLLELMSLLNFIMPSVFSSSTSQIAKLFSAKSSEHGSFEKDRIAHAKLLLKPFILRRVKSEVLKQLPAKVEKVELCPMSEKQQKLYSTLLVTLKSSATSEPKVLKTMMMQLRKMANHPLLHRQYYTNEKLAAMSQLMLKEATHHDANPTLIQEDMEVMSDFELHRLCQQYPILESYELQMDLLCDSGKFALLTELLASLKQKGDRVVLFSQFTMMLDIMETFLQHLGHSFIRLDGSTPVADRIVLIDKYNNNSEIFVFLLSTRAGKEGINLASANVVILHDIDLNPYNDKQAEDRCHRVGQTRTVQVFRLVSQESIEVNLLQISQRKLKLEQDVTAAEEGKQGNLSEDMASLLKTVLGL